MQRPQSSSQTSIGYKRYQFLLSVGFAHLIRSDIAHAVNKRVNYTDKLKSRRKQSIILEIRDYLLLKRLNSNNLELDCLGQCQ